MGLPYQLRRREGVRVGKGKGYNYVRAANAMLSQNARFRLAYYILYYSLYCACSNA